MNKEIIAFAENEVEKQYFHRYKYLFFKECRY